MVTHVSVPIVRESEKLKDNGESRVKKFNQMLRELICLSC